MPRSSWCSCSRSHDVALERVLDADRDPLGVEIEPARVDAARTVAQHRRRRCPATAAAARRRSSAASAPTVSTPPARSRSSAFGPTPGSLRTSSGARNAASWPGTTTTRPPGLRASLPTFATTLHGATPSEHVRLVAPRTAVCTASATTRARGSRARPRRGRGSPRRCRSARPSGRSLGPSTRRAASTRGRASAAAGRRPHAGSGGAPRPRSSPNGSRTVARRSSRSRRRRARAGRRRRPAAARGARGSRAPRRRRRTRRGRGARRSGSLLKATVARGGRPRRGGSANRAEQAASLWNPSGKRGGAPSAHRPSPIHGTVVARKSLRHRAQELVPARRDARDGLRSAAVSGGSGGAKPTTRQPRACASASACSSCAARPGRTTSSRRSSRCARSRGRAVRRRMECAEPLRVELPAPDARAVDLPRDARIDAADHAAISTSSRRQRCVRMKWPWRTSLKANWNVARLER